MDLYVTRFSAGNVDSFKRKSARKITQILTQVLTQFYYFQQDGDL